MGDEFTIANPTIRMDRALVGTLGARELVGYDVLTRVPAWLDRVLARPAIARGVEIPA